MIARPRQDLLQFILNRGAKDQALKDDDSSTNSHFWNSSEDTIKSNTNFLTRLTDQRYNGNLNTQYSNLQVPSRPFSPYFLNSEEETHKILDNEALMKNVPLKKGEFISKDSKRNGQGNGVACLSSNSRTRSKESVSQVHHRIREKLSKKI